MMKAGWDARVSAEIPAHGKFSRAPSSINGDAGNVSPGCRGRRARNGGMNNAGIEWTKFRSRQHLRHNRRATRLLRRRRVASAEVSGKLGPQDAVRKLTTGTFNKCRLRYGRETETTLRRALPGSSSRTSSWGVVYRRSATSHQSPRRRWLTATVRRVMAGGTVHFRKNMFADHRSAIGAGRSFSPPGKTVVTQAAEPG